MIKSLNILAILLVSFAMMALASAKSSGAKKTVITEKEAVQIAFEAAKKDEFDRFPTPHLKSVQKKSGRWTVQMNSTVDNKDGTIIFGGYYLQIIIDAMTGKIISQDAGGGS